MQNKIICIVRYVNVILFFKHGSRPTAQWGNNKLSKLSLNHRAKKMYSILGICDSLYTFLFLLTRVGIDVVISWSNFTA